jgi:hypothetical protein
MTPRLNSGKNLNANHKWNIKCDCIYATSLADAIKQNVPGVKYVSQPNWIGGVTSLMMAIKRFFKPVAIED